MGLTVRFVGARWLTPPPEDKAQTLCVWNGMPDVYVIRTIRSELEEKKQKAWTEKETVSDVYRAASNSSPDRPAPGPRPAPEAERGPRTSVVLRGG